MKACRKLGSIRSAILFVCCLTIAFVGMANAQTPSAQPFRARLSPAPGAGAAATQIGREGLVVGRLEGNRLTLGGTYRGLSSATTGAHLHMGVPGVPGAPIQPLQVQGSPDGGVSGTIQ